MERTEIKGGIRTDIYCCNHPQYSKCSLLKIGEIGLAIVQLRFNSGTKHYWWGEVDSDIIALLYVNPGIKPYILSNGDKADTNGLYPTVNIRRLMWALRMKPIKKEPWENTF
jgi:hypothetical protein